MNPVPVMKLVEIITGPLNQRMQHTRGCRDHSSPPADTPASMPDVVSVCVVLVRSADER